jgi:two-component system, chemotaxis family, sensor kinase CheA
MSDELLNEFLAEANESLTKLDQEFVQLEKNPEDEQMVGSIFRVMHTIKGTAGFLGFERLQKVAHAAENVMDEVRGKKLAVNPDLISLILESVDAIKALVEAIEQTGSEPDVDYSELNKKVNDFAKGGVKVVAKAPTTDINKTPDLDSPIDFDPIPAEYAEAGAETAVNKTPDLDSPIDFDPIPAEYAEAGAEEAPAPVAATEEQKKKAVDIGLKAAGANVPAKPAPQQGVRVGLEVLENLMQLTGELVLTRNQLLQIRRVQQTKDSGGEFRDAVQRLNILTAELQEGVLKTRMQDIGSVWAKFPRIVRDLSKELGKKAELKMVGEETDIDRQMIEAIRDPLTHMIRNAVDHGVEMPEERKKAGKNETGIITLSAYHEGGHIIIKINDDGKGIPIERVKKKALENGLTTEKDLAMMSDKQIFQFIFKPGFSTAEKVTSVSGRGVGMDVVLTNIEKIGGTAEINSVSGKGSEFLIKLPLTLAIMPVLNVECAGQPYAIPQIRVSEIVRTEVVKQKKTNFKRDESKIHRIEEINGKPVLRLRGKIISLVSLSEVLGLRVERDPAKENFIVICDVGSSIFGIMVEKVHHTEEIVVKPKSKLIKKLDVYSGSTILGDGSVIMIIDPNGVLKQSGITIISETKDAGATKQVFDAEEINFLMFKTNDKTPKAIPLELVSRLEEIDYGKAEDSAGSRLVQYRGGLMKLISIDDNTKVPETGIYDTVVFADRGHILGIVLNKVIDIVRQKMDIKSPSMKEGIIGSMIMLGETTEVIDVSYFLSNNFKDWLGHTESNKVEGEAAYVEDRKHVLLVDDSSFFRKFMRPLILAAGYRVSTAQDGREGLEILTKYGKEIDLVISDIDMPIMNGVEFVKAAKADDQLKNVPFIALTSHEADDFDEDVHAMGFEGFVTKSNRNKVVESIKNILKEKKMEVASV